MIVFTCLKKVAIFTDFKIGRSYTCTFVYFLCTFNDNFVNYGMI